jgi:quinol monooxygenase YgiN
MSLFRITRRSSLENTTVRVDSSVTTFVQIFKVEPQNQSKVLALFEEGIESVFSQAPGWISSNLHRSRDGRRIIVYAQWQDAGSIEAVRQDPKLKPYMARFAELGEMEMQMYLCDVCHTRHA